MTRHAYRGLTWDHPRGFRALSVAASQLDPDLDELALTWDRQSLEGFETHPIADLCARYDLVVLDHPHVGEAVAADCLTPLEAIFSADEIAAWGAASIGPSLSSYRFASRHWALPLDAATQVMAYRADRVAAPPTTWDAVIALSERAPVALSLSGPHAVLSFQSICAALGEAPAADPDVFIGRAVGREAFAILARLAARSPRALRGHNPIGLLEHMAAHDDVALCPLIYGYVNYAAPADGKAAIAFANAPSAKPGGPIGSTLGGTGIGVSKRCRLSAPLLRHLRWLMSPEAQIGFIPAHDGQPSSRAAWRDASVNVRWGQFYANTFETLEAAYVRPRHDGAIAFQTAASARLRAGLDEGHAADAVLIDLQAAYGRAHAARSEV